MLKELKNSSRVIGIKQVTKVVTRGAAKTVFIAQDTEERIREPLEALCQEKNVPVIKVESMKELGKSCGIEVGAAAAAIVSP